MDLIYYLAKLESYLEARLWNDIFIFTANYLSIKQGIIKAAVLCETIMASYQIDAILYELKEHSAGLNCGRWDYIFSFIKKFSSYQWSILADRSLVGMSTPWMSSYAKLLIKTCHQRKVHAMGGMAAQIPVKNDLAKNQQVNQQIINDKTREVLNGHDGSWVTHPKLIDIALNVFNQHIGENIANQINGPNYSKEQQYQINEADLLNLGYNDTTNPRIITINGIKANISAGIRYLAAWLNGNGCVPLHNKMEDAATAEISRCQLWQWNKFQIKTTDTHQIINQKLLDYYIQLEKEEILKDICQNSMEIFKNQKYDLAIQLFTKMIYNSKLDEFLTSIAYDYILDYDITKIKVIKAEPS